MTEAQLHRQVAGFLNTCLLPPAVWTTFPAGGGGESRGRKLKASGLRAGWPDIQIVYNSRLYLIELKAAKGRLSQVQEDCHWALVNAGCGIPMVCRSLEDVKNVLAVWHIPLRSVSLSTERMTAAIKKLRAREAAAGEVA